MSSITPHYRTVRELLQARSFAIDDYQREYKWESKNISERFGYRYGGKELDDWAAKVARLAEDAAETQVVFNNCYRDYAQVNARQLADRLKI